MVQCEEIVLIGNIQEGGEMGREGESERDHCTGEGVHGGSGGCSIESSDTLAQDSGIPITITSKHLH